ncbi:MerR family transcriptional regulator [Arenibaculum pallidiluteum]|uniref:MerR family transcriptional regulator n=1 Tax=Arenibaculum pallidiluteum TaxID=2812559 RepID=UPI001F39EA5C|nr:MerR family DNA-binding transcriptional regulator [Arenibaculum pallidiluteum]
MLHMTGTLHPEPERTWSISDLAEEFQITLRSIRFYEDQGLLRPRREGLTRIYCHRDRARLKLICRGKRLGFSLAEIRDFLDLYEVDDRQLGQMKFALQRARDRRRALERQLEDLRQAMVELDDLDRQIADHLRDHGIDPDTVV